MPAQNECVYIYKSYIIKKKWINKVKNFKSKKIWILSSYDTHFISKLLLYVIIYVKRLIYKCGGQNLSFCVEFKAPFTNNNASEEEKALGKAP